MLVEGMVKSSLVDFPGIAACVLFVPGCNYNCFYCHNRELINGSGMFISDNEIFTFLKKRVGLLGGVVITGGEPTLHKDLANYIRRIRELGYKIKLDTNGSNPKIVQELLNDNLCDYYAIDYKSPMSMYYDICEARSDNVLKTINLLNESNAKFEVRTTVYPQLTLDNLITMAKELPVVPKYVLNRYRKPDQFLDKDIDRINAIPYTQDNINEFLNHIRVYQPNVIS